ncbi:AAA family ATPase [Sphingobacterium prati]|uniref:AAA family ATPase n=1 Tax=Sphingobacterium prati TaxID=2737006 RepID=UPI001557E619|nr:AAA family ATPase [Sphingobacterium prati]NPE45501.1 AAA family ATPase [Sphingobacterium prati]
MDQTNYFIVLTGGPGVGKTTLLNKLQKEGYRTVPEEARRIIREQSQSNSDGLPWKNKQYYATLMLIASNASFRNEITENAQQQQYVFFDRGIPDTLAYIEMENLTVAAPLLEEARTYRYHKKIFILPPWQEIYETDHERKQTWEEAEAAFKQMKSVYKRLGYEVTEVPKTTVEQRYQFICKSLGLVGH